MQHSEWDKHLRDMLGDFRPGDDQPHWEEFARHLDARDTPSDPSDPIQDEDLHDALVRYQPEGDVRGWERIEASLDAADKAFDDNVRKKIQHYEPHFDPLAWPAFLKKFTDHKLLRAKLIMLKVVEFAAILLLVFTAVHMGRLGKLPFETPLFNTPAAPAESSTQPGDRADAGQQSEVGSTQSAVGSLKSTVGSGQLAVGSTQSGVGSQQLAVGSMQSGVGSLDLAVNSTQSTEGSQELAVNSSQLAIGSHQSEVGSTTEDIVSPSVALLSERQLKQDAGINGLYAPTHPPAQAIDEPGDPRISEQSALDITQETYITGYLAAVTPTLAYQSGVVVPAVEFIKSRPGTFVEFSVLTQADYNKLRMPEDRLYSAGKQIVFPSQGIPSQGYGAGFTIAIGHPVWALESGIIYSGKTFKPGRQLIVGGAFDNGSVEFEAMRLQMVSVPVQYRYRFERQGRMKAYALAGLAAHVIAQSDIDVVIKYHFPSLAAGANPNHDPYFAQTIRETRRISEHIRDGAPFSTKSFFSANAGLGLEYSLTPHKTLFLQTTAQYQIPNLKFSNNNGKHLRTVSVQAGVRTPLGE